MIDCTHDCIKHSNKCMYLYRNDGSLERLVEESQQLKDAYRHYFDLIIVNNDIEHTIHRYTFNEQLVL